MMTDWAAVRDQFPALANWTYLNTATFGQLPRCATEAVTRHFAHRDELACSDFLDWYQDARRIRSALGNLIGCTKDDIAFIANASAGLALLLNGLEWRTGDQVLTLDDEFPNQLYALGHLKAKGVEYVASSWDAFYESITDRTRLVAISSVNYNTGLVLPVDRISSYLKSRGILLYVDGTQSVGALRFDVRCTQPDMLAVHGYKWMASPTGAGFAYISPGLRALLSPSVLGWRSHRTWNEVDNLHHGTPEFDGTAEMFEGGGIAFPLILAMGATVELMLGIGPTVIEQRVMELAGEVCKALQDLGGVVPDSASPIVTARFAGADPSQLASALRRRRVLVAARKGQLRVAPHFYNDESDIEAFRRELHRLLIA